MFIFFYPHPFNEAAAAKRRDKTKHKKSYLSPSGTSTNIPEGSIWHRLNHACLTSCAMAPCCLDGEDLEVNVPEGDQVPEGTRPVGFHWYKQLIKYLWWDLTNEDIKL